MSHRFCTGEHCILCDCTHTYLFVLFCFVLLPPSIVIESVTVFITISDLPRACDPGEQQRSRAPTGRQTTGLRGRLYLTGAAWRRRLGHGSSSSSIWRRRLIADLRGTGLVDASTDADRRGWHTSRALLPERSCRPAARGVCGSARATRRCLVRGDMTLPPGAEAFDLGRRRAVVMTIIAIGELR